MLAQPEVIHPTTPTFTLRKATGQAPGVKALRDWRDDL